MTLEDDAEHLPALAFVPVGAGVDLHPRLGEHGRLVDVDLQREPQWRDVDWTCANTWKRPSEPAAP